MKKTTFYLFFCLMLLIVSCSTENFEDNAATNKEKNYLESSLKSRWITDAYKSIADGDFPSVKGVAWWHENFNDSYFRVDSSPESLKAYQDAVSSNKFLVTNDMLFNELGKLQPSWKGVYHGAIPDFGGEEDQVSLSAITNFEQLVKKQMAWVYFSDNWKNNIQFPSNSIETIQNAGRVPFVRLMPRTDFSDPDTITFNPDVNYSMQSIIDGDHDAALYAWSEAAADNGKPILAEFGTEVDGKWFKWNGLYNGGDTKNGYGDPNKFDGPERFVDAYRHIINIFRENGATNVTWFFHINVYGYPFAETSSDWNHFSHYYPGDDYIDWLGLSVYGPSSQKKLDEDGYQSFYAMMSDIYQPLTSMSNKPIAILEIGISEVEE